MNGQATAATSWACLGLVVCLGFGMGVAAAGCGGAEKAPAQPASAETATPSADSARPAAIPADAADEPLPESAVDSALPDAVRGLMYKPFTGDLDEMAKRRIIRLGVTFNRSFYFIDKGVQRGAAYEYGKLFEDELNKKLNTGNLKIHVLFVPLSRDKLTSALLDGRVDAIIAQITITPDKQKLVDFTNPTRRNINQVVVTGPGAPAIASVADLSGQDVFVRKDGTYHQSLLALNERFKAQGKAPVTVRFAADNLEDDDLLEMASAGIIPITVVDDYLAEFWKRVLPGLTVHETVTVRTGGELAVAIRKDTPQFKAALNEFLGRNGLGSAFGNMIEKRYLVSTKYVKNATSEAERKRMLALIDLFTKYSDQYDMDFLLMGAQGFQESGLNHDARSPVGAIGIMQVMPKTGAELNVGDITEVDANIHAGVKYMRFMIDRYFKDEPMDQLNKGLFALASYNAGPGRVRQLRKEAEKRGLDPNVWFGNVEQIASERIGRETVTYVSNIYKYYVAYRLMYEGRQLKDAAKTAVK